VTSAKPINGKNSIEATGFILGFDRKFQPDELERLLVLETELKAELPVFSKTGGMGVTVQDGNVTVEGNNFTGVALHKTGDHLGTVAWALRVADNTIHATCGDYDDWDKEWPKAKSLISTVLKLLNSTTLNISVVGCQVIDKFVYLDEPQDYSVEDIFSIDSELLTKKVSGSGQLWHIHQGWFDESSTAPGSKLLSQLNLSSGRLNNKLTTTIDHTMQLIYTQLVTIDEMFTPKGESIKIDTVFKELHDTNKLTLKKLLNTEKLIEIGLSK
jgi:hypothetical protein